MQSQVSRKIVKESLALMPSFRALTFQSQRFFGKDLLDEKEKGDEKYYFSKQDCKHFVLRVTLTNRERSPEAAVQDQFAGRPYSN